MQIPKDMFLLAARAGLAALKENRAYHLFGGEDPVYIRSMERLSEAIGDCSIYDIERLQERFNYESVSGFKG